jgi:hypothetical protein
MVAQRHVYTPVETWGMSFRNPATIKMSKSSRTWSKLWIRAIVQGNQGNQGNKKVIDKFQGHPMPVDTPASQRLEETLAGRKQLLCVYNEEMQAAPTVHFMCAHKLKM